MDLEGAAGTIYAGEKFHLQFKFGSRYPFDSPQVLMIVQILFSGQTFRFASFFSRAIIVEIFLGNYRFYRKKASYHLSGTYFC